MNEQETRDIAVGANVKVDSHIEDCIRFRAIIQDSFRDVKGSMNNLADQIKGLQIKAALAVGGLIVFGKALDYLLAWHAVK